MRASLNPVQYILIGLLTAYRWVLSPVQHLLSGPGAGCRFSPTCSAYSMEAIRQHGALRGSWLAAKRLCRCHPWGGCGHDPVPAKQVQRSTRISRRACA